jgi:putative transposase
LQLPSLPSDDTLVKAIAKTLDVARSNLIERLAKTRSEWTAYDSELLPQIKELGDARPTYGYRRITALLNRRFTTTDQPRVNHKRIYRIMQHHGLLLQRHMGRRIERAHDGIGM